MCACRCREFTRSQARLRPCSTSFWINLQRLHLREIEYDSTLRNAVAWNTMPTAANSQFDTHLTSQRNHIRDIVRVCDSYNRQWSAVNSAIEYGARLVVIPIVGCDHAT